MPSDQLVASFIHTSHENNIIEKVFGPGAAEEEMVNGFHISLKRCDFWLLCETQWLNDKVAFNIIHNPQIHVLS